MEHHVSSNEVKAYLQEKLNKLNSEVEVIARALVLLEEAELEVASNKLMREARQMTYNGATYETSIEIAHGEIKAVKLVENEEGIS